MQPLLCGVGVGETLIQTKGLRQSATKMALCVTDPGRQPFLGQCIFLEMVVGATLIVLLCLKKRATYC